MIQPKACLVGFIAVLLAVSLAVPGPAAAFVPAAGLGADPDIVGTWLGKSEIPGQGVDDFVLVFVKSGEGLGGHISDALGVVAKETVLSEVKLGTDKTVTFQFPLVDGAVIFCSLAIDQDKMNGTWQHPSGSTGALDFVRKK